jgi:putative nucleotidyltransferase with HDIG domain
MRFATITTKMNSSVTPHPPRTVQPWAFKNLPPFRPVAVKLMLLTAQDDIPLGKLRQVLRTDVAFSAEVLRLANSALTDSRFEVRSVGHAVEMLGLERLKALSITIAMRDFLSSSKSQEAMQLGWRYNLATAVICEWLARFLPLDPDTCYTAGLIHDIGRLAILHAFPEEYMNMLSVIEDYGFDLLRCEKDLFDIDHCEAGRWIMDHWGFPAELRDVAEFHHRQPAEGTPQLVALVYIAWQMADMLGFSPLGTRSAATIEEITATLPEEARQRIFASLDELTTLVGLRLKDSEAVPV